MLDNGYTKCNVDPMIAMLESPSAGRITRTQDTTMPRENKVPRTYKMLRLADRLVKEEAERTGKSEADIIAGAVLALFARYPEYQDRILDHINKDAALVELFKVLQSSLGEPKDPARTKPRR